MLIAFARRGLAVATLLSCLVGSRSARADDATASVKIETDGSEVFARTDLVTMAPVYVYRRGPTLTRGEVYTPLCAQTPCAREMEEGTYTLALSKHGGPLVEGDTPIAIHGPTTIRGTYEDRHGTRVLGVLGVLVLPLGGTAMMFIGSHTVCDGVSVPTAVPAPYGGPPVEVSGGPCPRVLQLNPVWAGTGIAVALAGLAGGLALIRTFDKAHFSIGPLDVGRLPGARESGMASAIPNGLELTMRF